MKALFDGLAILELKGVLQVLANNGFKSVKATIRLREDFCSRYSITITDIVAVKGGDQYHFVHIKGICNQDADRFSWLDAYIPVYASECTVPKLIGTDSYLETEEGTKPVICFVAELYLL